MTNTSSARLATPVRESPANSSSFVTGDGVRIVYRIDGPADRPALILSNSIGTNLHMWDRQVPELSQHFRVIRYDFRGHGGSDVAPGGYSDARLSRDVIELMDQLGIERAHFLGLSLGGFVGQWLAIHKPERIDRLILSNTAAHLGPAELFDRSITGVLAAPDMKATAETFIANWFPKAMVAENGPIIEEFRSMLLGNPQQGIAGSWAAVRDADMRRTIALITAPTLVIGGQFDMVTSVDMSREIASTIPGAKLKILPAVHLSNVEYPKEFTEEVLAFLAGDAA